MNVESIFINGCWAFMGVFADRIWRKCVEDRVRINIEPQQLATPYGIGVIMKITNCGSLPLPPFQLAINHPKHGSIYPFSNDAKNVLMSDQNVAESFILRTTLIIPLDIEHFFKEENVKEDYFFIMKQRESDKVLFKSKNIGNAIAAIYRQTSGGKDFENVKSEDWDKLYHIHIPLWKRLLPIKFRKPIKGKTLSFSLPVKNGKIMMTDKMHIKIIKDDK